MSKSNKIDHTTHIEESVEWILDNKANWTQYTNYAREKYHINNRQANDLWKASWKIISEDFEDSVKQSVNNALLELEQRSQQREQHSYVDSEQGARDMAAEVTVTLKK